MNESAVSLQQLYRRLARKRKMELMLADLQAQLAELEDETAYLYEAYLAEQEDVQRLEGETFSALLFRLLGKLEEKQEQNRSELYAAAAKYETALHQQEEVQAHIAELLRERADYADAEDLFTAAFQEKRKRLAAEDPQKAAEILALEQRVAALETEIREVEEAFSVGSRVLDVIDAAEEALSDAEGWSTFDLLGGGLVADMVKHDRLEHAQGDICFLQEQLRSYRTELADVDLDAEIRLDVGDFLRFADVFFDDIFSGITVMDHIVSAQKQLAQAKEKVLDVQSRLAALLAGLREDLGTRKTHLEESVVGA